MISSETLLDQIEATLKELTQEGTGELYDGVRYALLGGGKRIRPLLSIAACICCGGDVQAALAPSCALEMIHAYSLVHDDLPCMDDDDFRRGRPTVHRVYGDDMAVLIGDHLLTFAFEVLASAPSLSAEQRIELVRLLAQHAGGSGMVGGQAADVRLNPHNAELQDLKNIHLKKTAALIRCSTLFGGIVANASQSELSALATFGESIGLAFQIIDDVLDVTASEAKHGKGLSSDACNHKATYSTLLGIDNAQAQAQALIDESKAALEPFGAKANLLHSLGQLVVQRRH